MRVLLLNQVFYPDVAATAQHADDLARHLTAAGHQVAVIASRSVYGQRGAVLPKYEVIDGIEVHRVGCSLFGKTSILLRLADFALFYLLATVKTFTVRRPDVVVTFTTPPFIALVGWMMKAIKGTGFVYWVMDLYPDVPIGCGLMKPGGLAAGFFESLNRFCLRRADRAVVLGRCMQQRVLDKKVPPARVTLIGVWADASEVQPIPAASNPYRSQWSLGEAVVVMYSGNIGLAHDVATMCQAAEVLRDRLDIRFVFVGDGKRKGEIERYVAEHELANVQIHPYQLRANLAALLSLADVHLISQAEALVGAIVPCKLYGIMAAARPALFIGHPDAEIARVLVEHDCGRVVRCGDSGALVKAIQLLAADAELRTAMGRRARQALDLTNNRQAACQAWEQLLLQCARRRRRRTSSKNVSR